MRTVRPALELRMELAGNEPRMRQQLYNFDQMAVRGQARRHKPRRDEIIAELISELIAVAMAL